MMNISDHASRSLREILISCSAMFDIHLLLEIAPRVPGMRCMRKKKTVCLDVIKAYRFSKYKGTPVPT